MRLRPTPPAIPPDLLERYGEPEHVFGPNMRFRVASGLLGAFLFLLGLAFLILGFAAQGAQKMDRGTSKAWTFLALLLMTMGTAAIVLPRSVPLNWVFVCPRGLVRTLGADWNAVAWADVSRFEDASLSHRMVAIQQCRIITTAGEEWGFLANNVAGYERLAAILRQKVAERPTSALTDTRPD
jgi:hypothetical protein